MLSSILSTGFAIGAIYALIAVTYNVMFSGSRVMSFTAGQVGMLGGVFGAWFILRLHLPIAIGFPLTLLVCAGQRLAFKRQDMLSNRIGLGEQDGVDLRANLVSEPHRRRLR